MIEFLFEWDPVKAEANLKKHDIAFADAVAVFRDPFRVTVQDRIEEGEYRWQTIGAVNGRRFLLVAHVDRDDPRPRHLGPKGHQGRGEVL